MLDWMNFYDRKTMFAVSLSAHIHTLQLKGKKREEKKTREKNKLVSDIRVFQLSLLWHRESVRNHFSNIYTQVIFCQWFTGVSLSSVNIDRAQKGPRGQKRIPRERSLPETNPLPRMGYSNRDLFGMSLSIWGQSLTFALVTMYGHKSLVQHKEIKAGSDYLPFFYLPFPVWFFNFVRECPIQEPFSKPSVNQ